jgi:hypothetical protein
MAYFVTYSILMPGNPLRESELMTQQTVCFSGNAKLLVVQPGDGTRYKVMVGDGESKEECLIAVGTGGSISGGGTCSLRLLRKSFDLSDVCATDFDFCCDWAADVGIANAWTATIALAVAWFLKFQLPQRTYPSTAQQQAFAHWLEWFGAYYRSK